MRAQLNRFSLHSACLIRFAWLGITAASLLASARGRIRAGVEMSPLRGYREFPPATASFGVFTKTRTLAAFFAFAAACLPGTARAQAPLPAGWPDRLELGMSD